MTTVIKANYVKASKDGLAKVERSARYYSQRPNLDGEKEQRRAFNLDATQLRQADIEQQLKQALENDASHYYRMVLSPGEATDLEGNLQVWTSEVMFKLQEQQQRQLSWLAYEHANEAGHSHHAHVHVIVATQQKIDSEMFQDLRDEASLAWQRYKDADQELQLDPMQSQELEPELELEWTL